MTASKEDRAWQKAIEKRRDIVHARERSGEDIGIIGAVAGSIALSIANRRGEFVPVKSLEKLTVIDEATVIRGEFIRDEKQPDIVPELTRQQRRAQDRQRAKGTAIINRNTGAIEYK